MKPSQLSSPTSISADFALSKYCSDWTHHPVYGDASFDSFERLPGNPVCRGTDEYRWPVNGSLFKDPASGNWYLYVGWYKQGYAIEEGSRSHCIVFRSEDKGKTWQRCGDPIAGIGSHIFEGEISPLWSSPDTAVCYKDGLYHMSFDWTTAGITWENIVANDPEFNSGAGYAVSDTPAGPFQPVTAYLNTRDNALLLGKYKRTYASTILPRQSDWIALTLVDSQDYFGWGLLGQTSARPEGPWTKPKLLLHPQLDRYFPPLLEYFPAFIHAGYIYSPATSVAGNRNYQAMFRTPIEDAMYTDAWELLQDGSVWHSEPVEAEHHGIWGQTFSGFIDDDGTFYVMFPSRDPEDRGTIGLARRDWNQPMRERGFVVSGHVSPSITVLRHDTELQHLHSSLTITGTVQIIWNHRGPFAPDSPSSGCGLHPLMRTCFDALELSGEKWALIRYDERGNRLQTAGGKIESSSVRNIDLRMDGNTLKITLDDSICWEGPFQSGKGRVGLWVEPYSRVEIEEFSIEGSVSETATAFLYQDAVLNAAQNMSDWKIVSGDMFRYGEGIISKTDTGEAKWNFIGGGFALWAPTGSLYGKGELYLDGTMLAEIDFNSPDDRPSHIVYQKRDIPHGRHSVRIKVADGRIPVDTLEAFSNPVTVHS
ncbi:MAG: hypothetical protein ABFD46_10485 [Armatimonadota bacterium]